jgi:hypothetical protein
MSRIAKSDVNAALDRAAKNIVDAAGTNNVTSRTEMKKALENISSSTEKKLTDIFFRFIDHRDAALGARITASDVNKAVDYAKEHLLAKYDVNNNGFSKAEIAKMSVTGQLAVKLAAELKGVALPAGPTPSSSLGRTMTDAARDANWMSESDSTPAYVEASLAAGETVDGALVMKKFKSVLEKAFDYDNSGVDLSKYTVEQWPANEAATFLADQTVVDDPSDSYSVKNAAAWGKIKKVFDDNITDVKVFKVGPKDEQTGNLATDQGAYELFVVGKTADGKLAGITFESVET